MTQRIQLLVEARLANLPGSVTRLFVASFFLFPLVPAK